jgi:hypothetical protein
MKQPRKYTFVDGVPTKKLRSKELLPNAKMVVAIIPTHKEYLKV